MIDERLERMKRKRNCRVHFDADSFNIEVGSIVEIYDFTIADTLTYCKALKTSFVYFKDSVYFRFYNG